jgi:hypothetical protein
MSKDKRLNQILAVEKSIKTKANALMTELHRKTEKETLLVGQERTYQPLREDGAKFPSESKKVQLTSQEVFKQISNQLAELFDVTATKDWANCSAKADVVVNGEVLLTGVPSTYLLFLNKQLTDLQTLVGKFSELSSDQQWSYDAESGTYKTTPVETAKTEKVQEGIVLQPPTKEHPAQTVLVTKDIISGHWKTVYFSGALPKARKELLLDRIQKLLRAVKEALEEANLTSAPSQTVGEKVLNFIFQQ